MLSKKAASTWPVLGKAGNGKLVCAHAKLTASHFPPLERNRLLHA